MSLLKAAAIRSSMMTTTSATTRVIVKKATSSPFVASALQQSRGGTVACCGGARRAMAGQTVPRLGTEEQMKAEAIEHLRARVRNQKELIAMKHTHTHEQEVDEMFRWVKLTFYVAIPASVLSSLYTYFFDEHTHRMEGPLPDYMKIRSKEYPWECSDCDLFDTKCWKQCRAEKA